MHSLSQERRAGNDDRVDALAMAVAYFTDRLTVSQHEEAKRIKNDAFLSMLKASEDDPEKFVDDLVLGDVRERLTAACRRPFVDRPRSGNISAQHRKAVRGL